MKVITKIILKPYFFISFSLSQPLHIENIKPKPQYKLYNNTKEHRNSSYHVTWVFVTLYHVLHDLWVHTTFVMLLFAAYISNEANPLLLHMKAEKRGNFLKQKSYIPNPAWQFPSQKIHSEENLCEIYVEFLEAAKTFPLIQVDGLAEQWKEIVVFAFWCNTLCHVFAGQQLISKQLTQYWEKYIGCSLSGEVTGLRVSAF